MSSPIKHLWIAPGACSIASIILFHEISHSVPLFALSPRTPGFPSAFAHLAPKKKIPILEFEDGTTITEGTAIMTWISQQAPKKLLFGRTPLETVRVYEWCNYLSGTLHSGGFTPFFVPQRWVKEESDEEAKGVIREKAKGVIDGAYAFVEGNLGAGPYVFGEHFTAVDAYLFVFYRWGVKYGWDMEKVYPKYAALFEAVSARETVKKALKAEAGAPIANP